MLSIDVLSEKEAVVTRSSRIECDVKTVWSVSNTKLVVSASRRVSPTSDYHYTVLQTLLLETVTFTVARSLCL